MDLHKIESLIELTQVLYTKPSNDSKKLRTIAAAVNNHESGWLRAGERWDDQTSKYESISTQIQQLAAELGFIDPVPVPAVLQHSTNNHVFDHAILLGASCATVNNRMKYMVDCWNSGSRWKTLVLLGSDRSLDEPESDSLVKAKVIEANFLPTEMGMMKFVYYESLPHFPAQLQAIPVLFINTVADDDKARVDTQDTIVEWLKEEDFNIKDVRSVIAFSNQPYVKYQNEVLLNSLRNAEFGDIKLVTVGQGSKLTSAPILLDCIARYLFKLDKTNRDNLIN